MTATLYGSGVTDSPTGDRPDELLSVREVAEVLGHPVDYARTLITSGRLRGAYSRHVHAYRVYRSDLDAYIEGRREPDPSPMFIELRRLAMDIERTQARVADLIDERNRALVRYVDKDKQTVTAAAEAAKLGRQRASDILRITRAELAKKAAKATGR